MKTKAVVNPFCRRQLNVTDQSALGGWTGNETGLSKVLSRALEGRTLEKPVEVVRVHARDLNRDLDGSFVCTHAVVRPGEAVLEVTEVRRKGEQPVTVKTVVRSQRAKAETIDFVLYSHEALAKDGDASSDAPYELVSINTMPTFLADGESEPMVPATLWRNYLAKIPGCPAGVGGSYRKEWDDESCFRAALAASEAYWADKARVVVEV